MLEFICNDCGHIFYKGEEKHTRSGEGYFDGEMEWTEWTCCPNCEGGYSELIHCKICGRGKAYDADDTGNEWCEECKKEVQQLFDNFLIGLDEEQLRCLKAIWEEYDFI